MFQTTKVFEVFEMLLYPYAIIILTTSFFFTFITVYEHRHRHTNKRG